MEISINKKSGIPLYLQVKKQILNEIRSGSLKVGTKMPTERELSEKLKLSRNTISTAYKELEKDGVLKSYQGKGTFIAEEVSPWKDKSMAEKITKFIDLGLEEALESGLTPEEFIDMVEVRVKEKVDMMQKMRAVYIECNIEQSRVFAKQLNESINMDVTPLTINDLKRMDDHVRETLETSQVIIATFNHVIEVARLTRAFKKEVLGVAINADLGTIVRIARYPSTTKFGVVCISEEFMFKIQRSLEDAGLENISIDYTNSSDKDDINNMIEKSDVIIVSPGRYNDVKQLNDSKEVVKFIYSLDEGSVKALKSRLVEINMEISGVNELL